MAQSTQNAAFDISRLDATFAATLVSSFGAVCAKVPVRLVSQPEIVDLLPCGRIRLAL